MNLLDRARLSRVRCLALVAQGRAGARPTRGQVIRALTPISDELASLLAGLAPWEAGPAGAGCWAEGGRLVDDGPGSHVAALLEVDRGFAVEATRGAASKIGAKIRSGAPP